MGGGKRLGGPKARMKADAHNNFELLLIWGRKGDGFKDYTPTLEKEKQE